jgi:DNA invertase Pin-like site-specific DNA recombinase
LRKCYHFLSTPERQNKSERGSYVLIGYARVSTLEQETDLQLDALRRAGVQKIYSEKTGGVSARPQLQRLLADLKFGDEVVVYKLDRLARSLRDLLNIMDRIEAQSCDFRSLTEPINTNTAAGRMMMQMLGAVAEFERSLIRERSMAGQAAAVERGAVVGRRRSIPPDVELEMSRLYTGKGSHWYSYKSLGDMYGFSESAVKRAIYRVTKPGHSSLR